MSITADRLFELVSDFYWEQDAAGRFTRVVGAVPGGAPLREWLGKRPQDVGFDTSGDRGWPDGEQWTSTTRRFRDRIVPYRPADGTLCELKLCGEALLGELGQFVGSRGFGQDVTHRMSQQRELDQFRAAIDACRDMIFIIDRERMRFVYANETACRQTGFERDVLTQLWPHELLLTTREALAREYDQTIHGTGQMVKTSSGRARDGCVSTVEVRRRALYLDSRWLIVSVVQDISERVRAERSRVALERLYAALSATNEAILRATTPEELFQKVCDAAVEAGGFAHAAFVRVNSAQRERSVVAAAGLSDKSVAALALSLEVPEAENTGLVSECIRTGEPSLSNDYLADPRTRRWHEQARRGAIGSAAAVPLIQEGRAIGAMLLVARRVRAFDHDGIGLLQRMAENVVFALSHFEHDAERKRSEQYIQFMATHDDLTQLPNRVLFNQLLDMAIGTANQNQRHFAVMFLDLDRFKIINDSLGHDAGDALLKVLARRLRTRVRERDVVARIGGDEFLILIEDVDDRDAAAAVASTVLQAVLEAVHLQGSEYRVTASLGIAFYPDDGQDGETLLKNADMAMYQAKEAGKNTFRHYSSEVRARTIERITLESQLRRAVERDELKLVYQARISLASDEINGVEALLRWHSPELGELTPDQFLAVAEETGLIVPIGYWVLETACAQSRAWQAAGLRPVPIAVNISPAQFADVHLLSHIESILFRTGLAAERLELDIIESAIVDNVEQALDTLRAVKAMGVKVAIDNFGTGYSSLTQLRDLPIDSIKIDRSLIRDVSDSAGDRRVAHAIIGLGRNLSVNVVAEGVETAEQQRHLRSKACNDVQGFYFSRPDAAEAFADLLRTGWANRSSKPH